MHEQYIVNAWEVTWKNSTTADVEASLQNKTTDNTIGGPMEFILFPSTDAATAYVNSHRADYSLYSTNANSNAASAYFYATGHSATAYKYYTKHTGDSLLNSTMYELVQTNNIVLSSTLKYL